MRKCRYTKGTDNDYWSECHSGGFWLPAENMPTDNSPYSFCPFCGGELELMPEEHMPPHWDKPCNPGSYV